MVGSNPASDDGRLGAQMVTVGRQGLADGRSSTRRRRSRASGADCQLASYLPEDNTESHSVRGPKQSFRHRLRALLAPFGSCFSAELTHFRVRCQELLQSVRGIHPVGSLTRCSKDY